MKTLISPNEIVYLPDSTTGQRVAQVTPDDQTFPVGEPLFWMDCANDVVADQWYYDPISQTINQLPQPETTGGTTP